MIHAGVGRARDAVGRKVTSPGYEVISINVGNGAGAKHPLGQIAAVREALERSIDRSLINQVVMDQARASTDRRRGSRSTGRSPRTTCGTGRTCSCST